MILLLDLDETLIRPKIQHVHTSRVLSTIDARVHLTVGTDVLECSASYRPGLSAFFDWIVKRREAGLIEGPWLFGQGAATYVEGLLPALDPKKNIFGPRILTKEHCTPTRSPWVTKDLGKLPIGDGTGKDVSRMILVDNNPVSCVLYPENSFLVSDWKGDGEPDEELARVSSTLDQVIAKVHDSKGALSYAECLAAAFSSRHAAFKKELKLLRASVEAEPPHGASLKEHFKKVWDHARIIQEDFLRPTP